MNEKSIPKTNVTCNVQPLVIFNILDHFNRRAKESKRVIGTLLGVNNDGNINITNSFPVPIVQTKKTVKIDMEFHKTMYSLHKGANDSEIVVGWYSTGTKIDSHSKQINDFYGEQIQRPPIHLCVSTDLNDESLKINAFMGEIISLDKKKAIAVKFNPLQLSVSLSDTERISLQALAKAKRKLENDKKEEEKEENKISRIKATIDKLETIVNEIKQYLIDVSQGKIKPNKKIGRQLSKVICSLPKFKPEVARNMFNDNAQDLLMAVHLANITTAQLKAAEKIHQILF